MKTSEILKAAKARLTPETWSHDLTEPMTDGTYCAHLAIVDYWNKGRLEHRNECDPALDVFARIVSGTPLLTQIWEWNDAPERTYQDVMDAFSAAIAIAEEQEAREASGLEAVDVAQA